MSSRSRCEVPIRDVTVLDSPQRQRFPRRYGRYRGDSEEKFGFEVVLVRGPGGTGRGPTLMQVPPHQLPVTPASTTPVTHSPFGYHPYPRYHPPEGAVAESDKDRAGHHDWAPDPLPAA